MSDVAVEKTTIVKVVDLPGPVKLELVTLGKLVKLEQFEEAYSEDLICRSEARIVEHYWPLGSTAAFLATLQHLAAVVVSC